MTPEERELIDRRHAALARARSILGPVALASPALVAGVLFLVLRPLLLEPRLLGPVVLVATILDAMVMIALWRMVGRRAEILRHDLQMGLVEEHMITDFRDTAGLSRAGGRLDAMSLKRACEAFVESTEHGAKTGLASASAAFRLLSDLTPVRVTLLPRSRIVLRVDRSE